MRLRHPLPLLVAGAAGLLVLAFAVVQLGPPTAGPTGGPGASGPGVAASDETSSPGNGATATFSASPVPSPTRATAPPGQRPLPRAAARRPTRP